MTLLEIIITTVITGIIAALGTPSLMAMLQGDQVKQGVDQIQLALQDAQKQAIRHSKKCTIQIETKTDQDYFSLDIKDANDLGCLGGVDKELPKGIEVVMNGNQLQGGVTFSFKGTTTEKGTFVVRPTRGKGEQRCLVISDGLGIMRTGIYDANAANNTIDSKHCNKLTDN